MCHRRGIVLAAILAALALGCGKSDPAGSSAGPSAVDGGGQPATSTDPASVAKLDGPAKAVFEFLDAVRAGNDAKATQMLTSLARTKAAEMNRTVRPPASDTARFQVGHVEHLGNDGARVACAWTDLDEHGQPQTDEALWMVRREAEGWRIAGVAATVFPGEPPLLLDFEKPEEMVQKQQWVRDEIRRRAEEESALQAQSGENSEKSVRR
jgi:hypothetical protein